MPFPRLDMCCSCLHAPVTTTKRVNARPAADRTVPGSVDRRSGALDDAGPQLAVPLDRGLELLGRLVAHGVADGRELLDGFLVLEDRLDRRVELVDDGCV